jgi:uncharacterized membrane protein
MSDPVVQEKPLSGGSGSVKLVYVLYLVSLVVGITGLIGLIIAYVNKSDAPQWLQDHYRYQIRTFWMGLVYILSGTVLSFIFIGYLILLFWLVWLIVRCIKGLKAVSKQQSPEKLTSWFF